MENYGARSFHGSKWAWQGKQAQSDWFKSFQASEAQELPQISSLLPGPEDIREGDKDLECENPIMEVVKGVNSALVGFHMEDLLPGAFLLSRNWFALGWVIPLG